MHIIQTISLLLTLGALVCEVVSFLTCSLFESTHGNYGLFSRCSDNTCFWWNLEVFKNDPTWLQFGAVISIGSLGILVLLVIVLLVSCCVDDNVTLRYVTAAVAFSNVIVLGTLIGLYTIEFQHGVEKDIPNIQRDMLSFIDLQAAKLGLSYWLLVSAISINAMATLIQFCCLPKESYDY